MGTFPFGAPVLPRGVDLPTKPHPVLVLGAYPSALHVRWTPPAGFGAAVTALPVDNEPTPFWDGNPDQRDELVERWRADYFKDIWGTASPARLNGPCGSELEAKWLRPLGYTRADAFITDCLPTARASNGAALRLADRYAPVAAALGAPAAVLGPHPSEDEIVSEALREHAPRLLAQILAAAPDMIITLGNAAARVLAGLTGTIEGDARLKADSYGQPRHLVLNGRAVAWQALVHPATPRIWAERHSAWIETLQTDHGPRA
jgi:uracil-DNA glycosylase